VIGSSGPSPWCGGRSRQACPRRSAAASGSWKSLSGGRRAVGAARQRGPYPRG